MPVDRRLAIPAALTALVIARSLVFVWWPQSQFDADQAVTGLMAKHLSELRAFPVFWYGQTYMLGVEAWLAAPPMALFGASVTALKLPLLAMNVAIALLLFRGLTRDAELDEKRAAFATLFFVLAAPITAAHYVTANGGNVEPCLYVLLLWVLRHRPVWFGLVLGIGFLNREFTILRRRRAADARRRPPDPLHAGSGAALWPRVRDRGRRLARVSRPAASLLGRGPRHVDGRSLDQPCRQQSSPDCRAALSGRARDGCRRRPADHGPLARAVRPGAAAADGFRDREHRAAGAVRQRVAAAARLRHPRRPPRARPGETCGIDRARQPSPLGFLRLPAARRRVLALPGT